MPRRSTKKRKAASSSVGDGQGASKQGGKRKSAPAPAVRQTSPLATVLTPDTLGRSLGFLGVPSLIRSEMTAKFVENAAMDVWTAMDKKIGADEKADGDSPRDRVIRSSPQYRRHLLSEYAAKVEMMKPTNTEAVQYDLKSKLGDDLEFFVRVARVEGTEDGFAKFEGSRRKGQTTFVAGGVFKPSRALDNDKGHESIGFDLTQCNLTKWPLMYHFLHPKEMHFAERIEYDNYSLYDDEMDAMKNIIATIVAINRKNLKCSVVFAADSHYCIDSMDLEGTVSHTQGTMYPREWEEDYNDEEDWIGDDLRFSDYIFGQGHWQIIIR